jgi:DNA mismatch repair protein MutS2
MDRLLNELQKEKSYLERLNKEHIDAQRLAQEAKEEYLEKKQRFEDKLKIQQETIEKNNKYLNAGKKMLGFVDQYITKSKKKEVNHSLLEEIKKYLAVEKGKIEGIKLAEKLKSQAQIAKVRKKKPSKPEEDPYQRHRIKVGSTVKLIATKQSGTIESIEGETAVVTFGFLRMKVEKDKLMWIK